MLMVPSGARAGEYIYFTECPQLDYGTTSFDYTSVTVKYHAESSRIPLTYTTPVNEVCDISSSEFSNASVGDKIRVNFTGSGSYLQYKYHGTYTDFTDLEDTKSWGTNYVEATISDQNVLNILQRGGQDIQAGLNIQAASGYTVTSIELIRESSATPPTGYTWTATPHAGISITDGYLNESGGVYTLDSDNPDDFTFSGTGFIVITCTASNGLKASYMITILEEGQKRHWDFTRHQLVVGPYNDTAWRFANDNNWELHNYNLNTDNELLYRYNGDINNTPNGEIIAELNGSGNKQMWFTDGTSKIAIRNEGNVFENHNNEANIKRHSLVRFVAMDPNVTVHLGDLKAGDRVRMKIDKYGTDMVLRFSNAQDALGNSIDGDYQIGGSSDFELNKDGTVKKDNLDAYYNFIVDHDGEFTFTQTSSGCNYMKIYDIEVYRGDFKMSNEVLSSKKQLIGRTFNAYSMVNGYQSIADYSGNTVIPEQDLIKIDGGYSLHHRGKDETWCDIDIIHTSHNLNLTKNDFEIRPWTKDNKTYYTDVYLKTNTQNRIRNNEIFGSYILRIKLYDATKNYVTDYADRIVSIGYIEKVNHPITWDFTDLKTYLDVENDYLQNETDYDYNTTGNTYYDENNDGYDSHLDLSIWKRDGNDWRLDFDRKNPNGAPFAWGTQLYAGTKMFDETRGIGFAPHNNATTNYSLKITDGGLRIEDTKSDTWGWELSIHDIDGLAAVYIRYEPIAGKTPYIDCQYNRVVDGTTGKPNAHVVYNKDVPNSNDKVQGHSAMIIWDPEDGELGRGCTNEFKIYLNNVILKKIGTSKDQKKIGKTGYATESRTRDIDHSLTSYFTGLPIKAYTGYLASEDDYSQVVLKQIDNDEDNKVLPASTETGTNTGCILYHATTAQDKNTSSGLDGGIHLFVPDMHDTQRLDVNDMDGHKNIIKSFKPTHNYFTFADQDKDDPDNYIPYTYDNESTLNFVLSAKKYSYGTNGSNVESGYDVYFLRIDPNGKRKIRVQTGTDNQGNPIYEIQTDNDNLGWAYLTKNCAYIQIPKDKVKELTSNNGGNAKSCIIFEDDIFGSVNQGIATGINEIDQQGIQSDNDGWYMMDGRKINSIPSQKGLYIVNGKKVLVK